MSHGPTLRLIVLLLAMICPAVVNRPRLARGAEAGTPTAVSRALPLNRFEVSRVMVAPGAPYRLAVGVADDYFDGTSPRSRVRRHFRIARQLGVKYLRCAFSWNAIEKIPGEYDWTFWDMLVHEAERAHVELIPYVAYTPKWAAVSEQNFWQQAPRDPELYAAFMERVVGRYRGKIRAWELWNEPDNRDYWQGSVDDYAALVRKAAVAMRRADPAVVLVLGGMSRGPEPFFRALLPQVAGYVDVIAMHAYPESWYEERAETVFEAWPAQMAVLIQQEAPGLDFWINEMGYADYRFAANRAAPYGVSVFYDYEHTRAYQAEFLFKAEVMALATPRVSLTAWYRIDDFSPTTTHFSNDEMNYHLGLLDATGYRKPAFYALKFFEKLFSRPTALVPTTVEYPSSANPARAALRSSKGTVHRTNSDAVINVFQRSDSEVIVTGWLPSSLRSEVRERSGMSHDARQESVAVPLPCKSIAHARAYDVEGRAMPSAVRFANGQLSNISLSGDHVFVEILDCRN